MGSYSFAFIISIKNMGSYSFDSNILIEIVGSYGLGCLGRVQGGSPKYPWSQMGRRCNFMKGVVKGNDPK